MKNTSEAGLTLKVMEKEEWMKERMERKKGRKIEERGRKGERERENGEEKGRTIEERTGDKRKSIKSVFFNRSTSEGEMKNEAAILNQDYSQYHSLSLLFSLLLSSFLF